jgi:hypothetical protein
MITRLVAEHVDQSWFVLKIVLVATNQLNGNAIAAEDQMILFINMITLIIHLTIIMYQRKEGFLDIFQSFESR